MMVCRDVSGYRGGAPELELQAQFGASAAGLLEDTNKSHKGDEQHRGAQTRRGGIRLPDSGEALRDKEVCISKSTKE